MAAATNRVQILYSQSEAGCSLSVRSISSELTGKKARATGSRRSRATAAARHEAPAKKKFFSFSLLARQCTWHHRCSVKRGAPAAIRARRPVTLSPSSLLG